MKRFLLTAAAALAVMSMSSAASAVTLFPGDPGFQVFGDINNGSVSATIGRSGITAGTFTDTYRFFIDQTGVGSGSVTTSVAPKNFQGVTDLDISSVTINGIVADFTKTSSGTKTGLNEYFFVNVDVPIISGVENVLEITGLSRGNGSYGGQLTFEPVIAAVPEPAAWGMMIFGFGLAGGALRLRRKPSNQASFA